MLNSADKTVHATSLTTHIHQRQCYRRFIARVNNAHHYVPGMRFVSLKV